MRTAMKKEVYEFICPIYFLGYIFNADPEGLADEEIKRNNNILSGYSCFSASDDIFFSHRNDFFGFGADCVILKAIKL